MSQAKSIKNKIMYWVGASRAPFFMAAITPVILGSAIAWSKTGEFHWGFFLLTLVGAVCVNGGANVLNDYFDRRTDDINKEFNSPFTGGSRMMQAGLIKPSTVLRLGLTYFAVAVAIGLYLAWARGWPVLVMGLVGVLSSFFYTAPPLRLSYHWIGEFVVGFDFGVLVTVGSYYVQAQSLSWLPLLASIPLAFLIAAVLWINEIPDYVADKAGGKRQMVVRLGKDKAAWGYAVVMLAPYAWIVVSAFWGDQALPMWVFLGLLTLPWSMRNILIARKSYANSPALMPANATTPFIYLATGLLMSVGFVIDKFV